MKIFTKKSAAIAAASVAMGLTSIGAWGTLVQTWSYGNDTSFIDPTVFSAGSGSQVTDPFELSWGGGGVFQSPGTLNRSALTIGTGTSGDSRLGGGTVTGTVETTIGGSPSFALGQVGLGTTFTHWNNPISSDFATLRSGTIFDELELTGTDPNPPYPGATFSLDPITFSFNFRETLNSGPCAGGTSTPCGDLWGIVGTPNLNQPFTYQDPSSGGPLHNYLASIFVVGPDGNPVIFGALNDAQCQALDLSIGGPGQADNCQGFITAESFETTVPFGFAITTEPIGNHVPEPGSLALFGIALAALGFSIRRRKLS